MKKRLTCFLLAMLTVVSYPLLARSEEAPAVQDVPQTTAAPVQAPEATPAPEVQAPVDAAPAPAEPVQPQGVVNQFAIYVNGQAVADAHSILENYTTYVSLFHTLRALCPEVQFSWAGGDADVIYTGPGFTLSARFGRRYIVCNDRYLYVADGMRVHPQDGDLLVPVRVLAKAMGAGLEWDAQGVHLTMGTPLESGSTFYNATDLDLLARVIQHESGNQPLTGKIAVANVILNRVSAGSRRGFADSVSGVIYQKGQFPGATNATPKSEAILAAKLALDGANVVPGAMWFNGVGQSCWASRNKSLIANIGGHAFYG